MKEELVYGIKTPITHIRHPTLLGRYKGLKKDALHTTKNGEMYEICLLENLEKEIYEQEGEDIQGFLIDDY